MNDVNAEIIALLNRVPGIEAKNAVSLQSVLSEDRRLALPVWYVHPLQERAGPNTISTAATRQTITRQFVVITACEMDELETLRDRLFGVLHGKTLDPARRVSEVIHVQGEVVDVTASAIWWRDVFSYEFQRLSTGA